MKPCTMILVLIALTLQGCATADLDEPEAAALTAPIDCGADDCGDIVLQAKETTQPQRKRNHESVQAI